MDSDLQQRPRRIVTFEGEKDDPKGTSRLRDWLKHSDDQKEARPSGLNRFNSDEVPGSPEADPKRHNPSMFGQMRKDAKSGLEAVGAHMGMHTQGDGGDPTNRANSNGHLHGHHLLGRSDGGGSTTTKGRNFGAKTVQTSFKWMPGSKYILRCLAPTQGRSRSFTTGLRNLLPVGNKSAASGKAGHTVAPLLRDAVQDPQGRMLYVQLSSAQDLVMAATLDDEPDCHAYCIVRVGNVEQKTQACKATGAGEDGLNPTWNEVFCYSERYVRTVSRGGLEFEVWHKTGWGSDTFIGKAKLDLSAFLMAAQVARGEMATATSSSSNGGAGSNLPRHSSLGRTPANFRPPAARENSAGGPAPAAASRNLRFPGSDLPGRTAAAGKKRSTAVGATGAAHIAQQHLGMLTSTLPLVVADSAADQADEDMYGELKISVWLGDSVVEGHVQELDHGGSQKSDADNALEGSPADGSGAEAAGPSGRDRRDGGMVKSLPLVIHSGYGTLYEEPCVSYLKLQLVALRGLAFEDLLTIKPDGVRRVRLRQKSPGFGGSSSQRDASSGGGSGRLRTGNWRERHVHAHRRHNSLDADGSGGVAGDMDDMDELMYGNETDDDALTVAESAEDAEENTSGLLSTKSASNGIAAFDDTRDEAVPVGSVGFYYHAKFKMGSRTQQSKMRWMSVATAANGGGGETPLATSFLLALARPMMDEEVLIQMYLTTSKGRRGRLAVRVRAPLRQLLDPHSMGSVFGAGGKPRGVMLPVDGHESGALQVHARIGEADDRAEIFRVPDFKTKPGSTPPPPPPVVERDDGTPAPRPSKPPAPLTPLGSALIRIQSVNTSATLTSSHFVVIKVGPHWLRTMDRLPTDPSLLDWQVRLPIYDPATIMHVGIFLNARGVIFGENVQLVCRARVKLSTLRKNPREEWCNITLYDSGVAAGTTPAVSGAAIPLPSRQPVAVIQVQLDCSLLKTLKAYIAAEMPDSAYWLELDGGEKWDTLYKSAKDLTEDWLASCSPPISRSTVNALLDMGRTKFEIDRIKGHWERFKATLAMFSLLGGWFSHICSWKNPRASWEVVFFIVLLCYWPSLALRGLCGLQALVGVKLYRKHMERNALGAELHERERLARLAAAAKEEKEEETDVPVGSLADMKRKYETLVGVALLVQNILDDVASQLERLQYLLSWRDPTASWLVVAVCVVVAFVLQFLGLSTLLCVVLLWQVRPPALRDPIPPPPVNFFMRLPCQLDDLIGCSTAMH